MTSPTPRPEATAHSDLVQRGVRWARGYLRCKVVLAEIVTAAPCTPDVMAFDAAARSVYIECKVSRADFFADRKKLGHRSPGWMPGDLRWYLTPPGLVEVAELPEGWGLAECFGTRVSVRREPVLQERSGNDRRVDALILVSALRRHQLGIEWRHQEARFAPWSERALAARPESKGGE